MSGSWLQSLFSVVTIVCYIVLFFYLIKTVSVVIPAKDHKPPYPEGLALAYLATASWFTFFSVGAIPRFAIHCIDVTSNLLLVPVGVLQLVAVAATLIVAAFICNFSRSLFMLKSLDHGVFEPVPDWGQRLRQDAKGFAEFLVRLAAAALFLWLEYQLEAVGHAAEDAGGEGLMASSQFAIPARAGLWLYGVLVTWWWVARSIAGTKMPRLQLWFYIAGLANSFVLWAYSRRTESSLAAWVMVILALVSFIPSLCMLFVVARDIVVGVQRLREWKSKGTQPVQQSPT